MPRGLNPRDEAQLQKRLWTPANLGAACKLWFDPSDARAIALSSGAVTGMTNKGSFGSTGNLSQATGTKRPTFSQTAGPNNLPVITTDGGDCLNSSSFAWGSTGTTEFFVVARSTNLASEGGVLGGSWGDGLGFALQPGAGPDWNAGDMVVTMGGYPAGNAPRIIVPAQADTDSSWRVLSARLGTSNRAAINGTQPSVRVSVTTTPSALTKIFGIGSLYDDGVAGLTGGIGEVVVCHNLSDADHQRVEGYLAWKWGLTKNFAGNHPHKNRPPLIGV